MNASYKGSGLKISLRSVKAITPIAKIIELSKMNVNYKFFNFLKVNISFLIFK